MVWIFNRAKPVELQGVLHRLFQFPDDANPRTRFLVQLPDGQIVQAGGNVLYKKGAKVIVTKTESLLLGRIRYRVIRLVEAKGKQNSSEKIDGQ